MNLNMSNKLTASNSITVSNNSNNSSNSSHYLNINNLNNINILLKSSTMNAPILMSNSNSNSNASIYNQPNLQFSTSSSSISKLPLSLTQNQLTSDNLNSWNRSLNINNNNQLNTIMQNNTSSYNQNSFQLNHQVAQQPATCSLNNTLFVGNLHASLQEIDLIQVFRPFGNIVECCKKWLHFGFVKFITEEEACHAYVTLNGFRLKGRPMRLEFQNRTKKVINIFQSIL
jgi:RNA recognition motif-containing protein